MGTDFATASSAAHPKQTASSEPAWIVIACRRYLCTICDAVLTVVPRGIASRRHYGHAAITATELAKARAELGYAGVKRR